MNPIQKDPFLTKQEAADYLRISTRTLDRRQAEGTGPARVKHGAKVGYFLSALLAWLESLQTAPVRG